MCVVGAVIRSDNTAITIFKLFCLKTIFGRTFMPVFNWYRVKFYYIILAHIQAERMHVYTDVVGSGREMLELEHSVLDRSVQQHLLNRLGHTLLGAQLDQDVLAVGRFRCQLLEYVGAGDMLLRTYQAPALYLLVAPELSVAPSLWVEFESAPVQEADDQDGIRHRQMLEHQAALALAHMRARRLKPSGDPWKKQATAVLG